MNILLIFIYFKENCMAKSLRMTLSPGVLNICDFMKSILCEEFYLAYSPNMSIFFVAIIVGFVNALPAYLGFQRALLYTLASK